MPRLRIVPRGLILIALLLLLCGLQPCLAGDSTGKPKPRPHAKRNESAISLEEAQAIVAGFQKAMGVTNKHILNNPQRNVHKLMNSTGQAMSRRTAAPLAYTPGGNGTAAVLNRRATNQTATAQNVTSYTVPAEVIKAARMLAESSAASSPGTSREDYASMVANLRAKFNVPQSDTNVPPQRLKSPSGLVEYVPYNQLPEVIQNGSAVTGPVARRAAAADNTSYWQETMTQLGSAPYAPSGYKVWRNVRDYGAKGDGVTDDTAAIQLAISDGGRCGAGCPSSTAYPATVYFPSGTYLVSSSITQYYNTEMLGNPLDLPTIVASSSFVGLGVISSDVYTGAQTEWYLDTNNFLRSVRNFIIDIRATPQNAAVCGIHWQVAQASSLENIYFWQTLPSNDPSTTQQGIYMENGSGGFMADLYFFGGKFGAFFGNQQFTARGLRFVDTQTGLQISWDWGWTMQDLTFLNCDTGVIIVGGAGGEFSTGQGVGSLVLTDISMSSVSLGIKTSLLADNSSAFLLQNALFNDVATIILDSAANVVLYPGASGSSITVDSWGFGQVANASGDAGFINGQVISTPTRPAPLVGTTSDGSQPNYFSRRRPSYASLGNSQLVDVKAYGAAGDGVTDDTAVLNFILSFAANLSAIVYFPQGVYVVSDTLNVPAGSRIIGQAWPQIMAAGSKFQDVRNPHVAVQVGDYGSVGIVEIQCMMFTVRGPTAGAVLMEWNVHESSQGSAGLWDSHFRVGGAVGSDLQLSNCPTTSHSSQCVAASLLMHITQKASAYLENVWLWVADHDMDDPNQTQINVFAGRGLLIESQGPTWLWGTAVEHAVLYNYQLSSAQNVVMGLIQTEAPYFQPDPAAPNPFSNALVFSNDPTFSTCASGSTRCGYSWAARLIGSSNVIVLSTGLYTWFQNYDQTCVNDGLNNCQQATFYVEQSDNVWVFNLITIGAVEMASPLNGNPIIAADNRNGFASSLLAWLAGANATVGSRNFTGYELYTLDNLTNSNFPATCQTALTATIQCDAYTLSWIMPSYHGSLENDTLQDMVCDAGCGQSLADWNNGVTANCQGYSWQSGAPLNMFGGYIWYGYNETCDKDASSGQFCNDVIDNFTATDGIGSMPTSELCSGCYLGRLQMMQQSSFSVFNVVPWFQTALTFAVDKCALANVPTSAPSTLIPADNSTVLCVSGNVYTTQGGDTCNSIAEAHSVSSAALFMGNSMTNGGVSPPLLSNCTAIEPGLALCLPLTCETYLLRSDDDCISASLNAGVADITVYNTWIDSGCTNIHTANVTLGSVLCASPQGGTYVPGPPTNTSSFPGSELTGYGTVLASPPAGATLAPGTTTRCSAWYTTNTVAGNDSCASITLNAGIGLALFAEANPSVNITGGSDCTASLIAGDTYCVSVLLPNTTTSDIIPSAWQPLGCWTNPDPSSAVLLGGNYTDADGMTVEECGLACAEADYALFALGGSDNCLCGSVVSVNSRQVAPGGNCTFVCAGNASETCGGSGNTVSLWGATADDETHMFDYVGYGCVGSDRADSFSSDEQIPRYLLNAANMSVDVCAAWCLGAPYQLGWFPYFAVTNGSDCLCQTSFNVSNAGAADAANCQSVCPGDSAEYCGGLADLDVYAAQTAIVISTTTTVAASSATASATTVSGSSATASATTSSVAV
ncbi:pectate lyase superfamily protein-domain-containing protein [Diplogelasinospora grovesii]|uniref:Pectate lyase superfamily protein-domain-containing protein n=1 Tax=Diplogelasinospora grovesii TaxID=303347 RepID=A0AAN6N1J6_9PEZI|nr:pectate lyase superfamily protein-domain-containing protein [Diplogelasinospora grovesii]